LYKRGYRQDAGGAPMQETLAAALLRLAKFRGDETVIDPCCGSGTLLIEAALIATKTSPGYIRQKWGFFNHPHFINQDWLMIKNAADAKRVPCFAKLSGCEIESDVARICRANLRAAGFLQEVNITRGDFTEYTPPSPPNFLITNPPHGRRLQGDRSSLNALYRNLGNFMKQKMSKPSKGYVFVGDLPLAKEVGLAATQRHVINNSGIDSRLLEFDLY
jgi:putative N6-adenine-specific DNA methylase